MKDEDEQNIPEEHKIKKIKQSATSGLILGLLFFCGIMPGLMLVIFGLNGSGNNSELLLIIPSACIPLFFFIMFIKPQWFLKFHNPIYKGINVGTRIIFLFVIAVVIASFIFPYIIEYFLK